MFLRIPTARALRAKAKFFLDRVRAFSEFPGAVTHLKHFVLSRTGAGHLSLSYSDDYLDAVERTVISKMRFLQYAVPPESGRYLIFKDFSPECGLGAYISIIGRVLTLGSWYDRTVIFNHPRLSYDFPYESMSNLSINDVDSTLTDGVCFNDRPQREKIVYWTFKSPNKAIPLFHTLKDLPFRHLFDLGFIMENFLKLREEYRAHIEERRLSLGLSGPRIGVHIRHGDLKSSPDPRHTVRCFAVGSYIVAIERMAAAVGVKTVFVATDSDDVLRQLPKDSGLDFIYDDQERRYDNYIAKMIREKPSLKRQETMTVIRNIYLLADCNYFVYSNSALARCAVGLSYYRNRRLNAIYLYRPPHHGELPADSAYINSVSLRNPANCRLVAQTVHRPERDSLSPDI